MNYVPDDLDPSSLSPKRNKVPFNNKEIAINIFSWTHPLSQMYFLRNIMIKYSPESVGQIINSYTHSQGFIEVNPYIFSASLYLLYSTMEGRILAILGSLVYGHVYRNTFGFLKQLPSSICVMKIKSVDDCSPGSLLSNLKFKDFQIDGSPLAYVFSCESHFSKTQESNSALL